MSLSVRNIDLTVDNETYLADINADFLPGMFNTLLGPTLSGKTSLLRVLAGLDKPDHGEVALNGVDITSAPAKKRNVAFVYQQFINYPAFSVFENIASPLKVASVPPSEIKARVEKIAELVKIENYLSRKPSELSGGQQQRVALARALVREADIVLLDEPLGNLDYKLREELREELPKLFKQTNSIVVYATTEPEEALMLGGTVTLMSEGRILQHGKTMHAYNNPNSLNAALTFSDPPINIFDGIFINIANAHTIGVRPHHIKLSRSEKDDIKITATVFLSEITGSETYVHVANNDNRWILSVSGVHQFNSGEELDLYINSKNFLCFDEDGNAIAINRESA
ncbi:ABC transporter ATP-binding protein [Kordiimonas sp. SCSIO 12610]|uniref:ABC transporter ATP-binding protein n=1 Tax=Kordiimonas sp. SCSIO 12610 TaxID=2829597 RepID=UPI0021098B60|nr:ABC transporter ATP-binding protein [Kordiimonas sp. SCSIO 12610]UTW53991.1 ABC transporter ATP-binding protein [Kordiimonas sp. SCSIO 12610]